MQTLSFVTGNQNKLREAQIYLPDYLIQGVMIDLPETQTVHVSEVIRQKIQTAFGTLGTPCFVMDSSLVIDGLCDQKSGEYCFPGALIKDVFAHMGAENICQIVRSNKNHRCTWSAMIGYHDGESVYFFEAHLSGQIASTPRGDSGYNWDTIFIPEGIDKTFAQMDFTEKQSYALTPNLYAQFSDFLCVGPTG